MGDSGRQGFTPKRPFDALWHQARSRLGLAFAGIYAGEPPGYCLSGQYLNIITSPTTCHSEQREVSAFISG